MKTWFSFTLLVFLAITPVSAASDYDWCSISQVEQIGLSIKLADYPLPQGRLKSVIGDRKLPHLGVSSVNGGKPTGVIALTDPEAPNGYFAVRIIYDLKDPLPKPEEIPLEALQLIYVSQGMTFVCETEEWQLRQLPELKKMMKKPAMTPIAFSKLYFDGPNVRPEPNKALVPNGHSRHARC